MTFEAMHNAIRSRFRTQIEGPLSLATLYDNQNADPPDDAVWCRLTVLNGDARAVELGGTLDRSNGVMTAQLFGPIGLGDASLLRIADRIAAAFKRAAADGVRFQVPYVNNLGRNHNNWQINVVCPYVVDHTS